MAAPTLTQAGPGQYLLTGELSFDSVVPLLASGRAAFVGQSSVQVDLSGVSYADSAGMALLLEWLREARSRGAQLEFRAVPAQLHALAKISEVAELLG